ncbi:MAG: hypothetical protein WBE50_16450, partial [Methyloceanibacter sp.]
MPPRLEAGRGSFKRHLELLVGEFLECLQDFPVIGVDAFVSHVFVLFQCQGVLETVEPGKVSLEAFSIE